MKSSLKVLFPGLRLPIIQAPMAGGINNPIMVAKVANKGAIGSFGFAYSTPEKIDQDLISTKNLTTGLINANFFVFSPIQKPTNDDYDQAIEALQSLHAFPDLNFTYPKEPFYPSLTDQLEPIWKHKPALLTFHFGIPHIEIIEKAHSLGIKVGITATSLEEALQIQAARADLIILQGIEAGGHRGIFTSNEILQEQIDEKLSIIDLLQSVSKEITTLPLVASGGIMSGKDVKHMFLHGASFAQMGTAFVTTKESSANELYKQTLLSKDSTLEVTYTRHFSGRPAQGIKNTFIKEMQSKPYLPFPIQNTLTNAMRQTATRAHNTEYQSLWAGRKFNECQNISIDELLDEIEKELAH